MLQNTCCPCRWNFSELEHLHWPWCTRRSRNQTTVLATNVLKDPPVLTDSSNTSASVRKTEVAATAKVKMEIFVFEWWNTKFKTNIRYKNLSIENWTFLSDPDPCENAVCRINTFCYYGDRWDTCVCAHPWTGPNCNNTEYSKFSVWYICCFFFPTELPIKYGYVWQF